MKFSGSNFGFFSEALTTSEGANRIMQFILNHFLLLDYYYKIHSPTGDF